MTATPSGRPVRLEGITHRFRSPTGEQVTAIEDIDLEIEAGSFVCLVGPSGCGKSTLLRVVAGFLTPTEGSVSVGDELVRSPSHERGVVFQQPNLYPWLSVLDNVAFGPRMRGVGRRQRSAIALRHLELVGLADFAAYRPYELSGGMQQRCQLARVLANEPSIILMDEPFGALDAITRDRMQEELLRIWRATGRTILFVTHSVDEAVYLATRVVVLSARPGHVVLDRTVPFSTEGDHEPSVRRTPRFATVTAEVAAHLDLDGQHRRGGVADPIDQRIP